MLELITQTIFPWLGNHLLAVVAVTLTVILIYHYLIEKETGIRLSKRYRNSIFEAQSKVFLNATQYLISGEKDLAIREFLSAVDINRDTVETYFALGGLFRSNGEIDKAISIHRSLIARETITEADRLRALKELAHDFDKGGIIDKAIETYKDVLKINRDEEDVILSLCRIYEDIQDWEEAYKYRVVLSKVGLHDQSETISHILVEKAKIFFDQGDYQKCSENLEDAFRFAPSVSAKILKLKLILTDGALNEAQELLLELLKEYPVYTSFIFESLSDSLEISFKNNEAKKKFYKERYILLKNYFLELHDLELLETPATILSKVRLLKESKKIEPAYDLLKIWMQRGQGSTDVMRAEFVRLLIDLGKKDEALEHTVKLLDNFKQTLTKHFCRKCGYNSDDIFWRCPQCHTWETIQFRWKV